MPVLACVEKRETFVVVDLMATDKPGPRRTSRFGAPPTECRGNTNIVPGSQKTIRGEACKWSARTKAKIPEVAISDIRAP